MTCDLSENTYKSFVTIPIIIRESDISKFKSFYDDYKFNGMPYTVYCKTFRNKSNGKFKPGEELIVLQMSGIITCFEQYSRTKGKIFRNDYGILKIQNRRLLDVYDKAVKDIKACLRQRGKLEKDVKYNSDYISIVTDSSNFEDEIRFEPAMINLKLNCNVNEAIKKAKYINFSDKEFIKYTKISIIHRNISCNLLSGYYLTFGSKFRVMSQDLKVLNECVFITDSYRDLMNSRNVKYVNEHIINDVINYINHKGCKESENEIFERIDSEIDEAIQIFESEEDEYDFIPEIENSEEYELTKEEHDKIFKEIEEAENGEAEKAEECKKAEEHNN